MRHRSPTLGSWLLIALMAIAGLIGGVYSWLSGDPPWLIAVAVAMCVFAAWGGYAIANRRSL